MRLRWPGRLLLYALIVGATSLFYLRRIEQRVLFVPYGPVAETPQSVGCAYQDIRLVSARQRPIEAWWVPAASNGSATVYILHGNGGNMSHRVRKISFFHELGYNVFIIDYGGYGRSPGEPTEKGLYADATAGYAYLVDFLKIPPESIVLYGESLGGAVAIDLATRKKVRALITEGTFSSLADMAHRIAPAFPFWALRYRFDSVAKIDRLALPILMIHSRNDEVVPFDLGRKLYEAASSTPRKELVELSGGHNEAFYQQKDLLKKKIERFLR